MDFEPGVFETCVCMWDWWDGPLFGISMSGGEARYFQHRFSEELDDYSEEFLLWQCSPADLEAELRMWELWVRWRRRFDLDRSTGGFKPDVEFRHLEGRVQASRQPSADTVKALPAWRLAADRSYNNGPPQDLVAWTPA